MAIRLAAEHDRNRIYSKTIKDHVNQTKPNKTHIAPTQHEHQHHMSGTFTITSQSGLAWYCCAAWCLARCHCPLSSRHKARVLRSSFAYTINTCLASHLHQRYQSHCSSRLKSTTQVRMGGQRHISSPCVERTSACPLPRTHSLELGIAVAPRQTRSNSVWASVKQQNRKGSKAATGSSCKNWYFAQCCPCSARPWHSSALSLVLDSLIARHYSCSA